MTYKALFKKILLLLGITFAVIFCTNFMRTDPLSAFIITVTDIIAHNMKTESVMFNSNIAENIEERSGKGIIEINKDVL